MKKIGLLSDTHGYMHPRIPDLFKECDEIWHAGDIGDIITISALEKVNTVRAVYGNIDGVDLRKKLPEILFFTIEKLKVLMIHTGGYPGKYTSQTVQKIEQFKPGLFISGHSHILKVMPDKKYNLLHINPGAAGKFGLHRVITLVTFKIRESTISDLKVIELPGK